jgi:flagellar basal body P-ring formation protein FlgA
MRLPLLSRYSVAALLLCCAAIDAATPAAIQAAIEHAARAHLSAIAASAGLRKPSVDVATLPQEAVNPCIADAQIEAIDIRSVTRMRFAATCDDPASRTEFVVRGSMSAEVVVAATDMRAGDVIDVASLALERRDITAPTDALSDFALVAGKASRRALRAGHIVNRRWLVEPVLVKRGAKVTILARNVGVEVQVAGEALATGRRNEIVQVRNKANGGIIRGRVIGENTVEPVTSTDGSGDGR